jgi:PAT family beta-lactamase induction signal transducer AmpG
MACPQLRLGGHAPVAAVTLREFWNDSLATRRGRLLTFFLLYVSEGIPLGFTATVIATHMRRDGVDPALIGAYVGSLYLPWAFKWAFGPIVDTITSVRFGRRRTWIVGAQLGMMVTLLVTMPIDFSTAIYLFTGLMLVHNVCAATQDVAIDALAVQVLPSDERGAANGFMFAGQSIGQAVGGSGVLMISSMLPFKATFLLVIAALGVILVTVSWRLREPTEAAPAWAVVKRGVAPLVRITRELSEFVRAAYRAFTGTRAAKVGLLFAVLPLGSYALVLSLQSNLAVELGLDDESIGMLGLWSSLISAAGCVVGGWLSDRYGRRRMIALFVALTAIPTIWLAMTMYNAGHIMPVDVAHGGAVLDTHVVNTFWTMCILFNFANGLTYGSSTALYMDITTPAVAATQFTAYMALNNLVTTYTSTWQGQSITHFGYPITLGLDATAGLICIFVLPWLGVLRTREPRAEMETVAAS